MVIFLFLLFPDLWALEPKGYDRKPELTAKAEVSGRNISFQYGFKNLKGEYQEWSWQDDHLKLRDLSQRFGMYLSDPDSKKASDRELGPGLFLKHPLVGAIPDYNKLISLYQGTVTEIHRHWKDSVNTQSLGRRESIELLLRFFQDFPYGIPPSFVGKKYIGGLLVPPLSLENGWADCDSKSLLMATVLSLDPYFRDKMAMILVPGHALLGIEGMPQTYDETYEFQNRTFVVAEPTGLGRTPFGRRNSPYSTVIAIIPLQGPKIVVKDSVPTESGVSALGESDCPDEGLLVEHFSKIENAKVQACMLKVGEEFIKHGPLLKFDPAGNPKGKEFYIRGQKQPRAP